jgi:hypothetical protein
VPDPPNLGLVVDGLHRLAIRQDEAGIDGVVRRGAEIVRAGGYLSAATYP